jgi:hypothetical protein
VAAEGPTPQNAPVMPPPPDAVLQDLRLRYQAAYAAYQACATAVTEATMSGEVPSPTLLEQEAIVLGALTKARANFLAAMAHAARAAEPPAHARSRDTPIADRDASSQLPTPARD